ncbi:hypothetical protein [uncultured Sphingopyxis sp.]|uniref:hypothetical protein n=1 Tax=uncultured Sphingopyxis sp. TaxID=310581 RepID=UPI0025E7CA20|nr:hypothetical protein [uncultured Sphingopyxis sp.]
MISALLSLALAATSTSATDAAPAKPVKTKKICEKIEVTGSTVPKRVCRTVTEPAKPKAEAEQAASDAPSAGAAN